MFEQRVLYYLQQYLGQYVSGLDSNALRISVLAGDVVLRNLQLKPEALNSLDLPITVKAGLLGSLKLKIPWRSLGQSPVIVEIDSIFVLACPKTEADVAAEEATASDVAGTEAAALAAKQRSVDDKELAWVHQHLRVDKGGAADGGAGGGGFLRAMIDTIIGNLQMKISNIHVRYEDDVNVPGCPIALGFTMEKLSAHTIDEAGKEVFVHKNALDLLRKASELKRLAVYLDVHATLWQPPKPWADMQRQDWNDLFLGAITAGAPAAPTKPMSDVAAETAAEEGKAVAERDVHTYVLKPVDGQLHYTRRGRNVRKDESLAIQEAHVNLHAVSLHISRDQFQSLQKVSGEFATYASRAKHWHNRPKRQPVDGKAAVLWWKYAGKAVQDMLPTTMQWKDVQQVGWMRRKYIPAYVECLQQNKMGGNEETNKMDESLPEPTILLFRRLAHTQVEREKRKAALTAEAQKRAAVGGGWFGGWFGGGAAAADKSKEEGQEASEGELSEEEIDHLRQLVTEQEDALDVGKESPNSVRLKASATVGSAAVVLDSATGEVLRGALEGLTAAATMFPKTVAVNLGVHACGVTHPEGTFLRAGFPMRHLTSRIGRGPEEHMVEITEEGEEFPEAQAEEGDGEGDPQEGGGRSRALQLGVVQNPQDGSADFAVSLVMSSSYVTYSAAVLVQLRDFFHVDQVPDLSVVAAQAAVQVDRAREAARRQVAAALSAKPKLQLHVSLDAPKVAVPIPAAGDEDAVTVVLDFGRFVLDSNAAALERLGEEEAAVYLPFQLVVRNVSAYLVDGAFDWAFMGARLGPLLEGGGIVNAGQESQAVVIPVLERCEMSAELQVAKSAHPVLPPLRLGVTLPTLRFFISPARLHRVMRVLAAALPAASEEALKGAAPKPLPAWRENSDKEGPMSVLVWSGLGHSTAQWQQRHGVLHRGSLHLLHSHHSPAAVASYPLRSDRRITALPPQHIGDIENCLVICPKDADLAKIAEESSALILRVGSADEVEAWKAAMVQSRHALGALTGAGAAPSADLGDWDSASVSGSEAGGPPSAPPEADPSKPTLELRASLGEFAIFLSGRVAKDWWPVEDEAVTAISDEQKKMVNVDGERALICVRASGAHSEISLGPQRIGIGVAIGTFEIEDLLVGPICKRHSHLARSYESAETSGNGEEDSEGDEFFDPSEASPARTGSSPLKSLSRRLSSVDTPFFDADDAMPGTPRSGASGAVAAEGGSKSERFQAWTLDFQIIKPDSPLYTGVDSDMSMKLTSFWFFCNRPTVGALIGFGTDMADAVDVPEGSASARAQSTPNSEDKKSDADEAEAPAAAQLIGREESGKLVLEGGQGRTVFRLSIAMARLEAAFSYETADSPPLGTISVQDTSFSCNVHPDSIIISAGLGNVTAIDASLEEDNPYRKACQPREGSSTSLIKVDIASHSASEPRPDGRIPDGLEYWSVHVHVTQLEVVFLYRFLQELLGYIGVLLALRPEVKVRAGAPAAAAQHPVREGGESRMAALESQAQAVVLQLDVKMEAPVIIMPRSSDSDDKVVADLGSLQLGNVVRWLGGGAAETAAEAVRDPSAVLLDTMTLTMRGLGAKVDAEGHSGDNIVREYDEGTQVVLKRALQDVMGQLPAVEVAIALPAIKASLSDYEYQLITSVAGANLGEELHLCEEAGWMQSRHAPTAAAADDLDHLDTSKPAAAKPKASERPPQRTDSQSSAVARAAQESARTRVKAVVNIGRVELEMLRNKPEIRTIEPLARFQVSDLWVSYHALEGGRSSVQLSLPHVLGIDARPGVLPEHSLVISAGGYHPSVPQAPEQALARSHSNDKLSAVERSSSRGPGRQLTPSFATLQFDQSPGKSVLAVRVQQPNVVAEVGFILAVAKFVYPSLPVAGVAPIPYRTNDILLQDVVTEAEHDLYLSPQSRLLADSPEQDDYVYDGCGHLLVLPADIGTDERLPLIIVGAGKTLQLRNVVISGAVSLPSCLHLGPGAQFVAHPGDNVEKSEEAHPRALLHTKSSMMSSSGASHQVPDMPANKWQRGTTKAQAANALSGGALTQRPHPPPSEFQIEVVALDVGLHFVEVESPDSEEDKAKMPAGAPGASAGRPSNSVRMLAAYFDAAAGYATGAAGTQGHAALQGLRLESHIILNSDEVEKRLATITQGRTRVQGRVLEPCRLTAELKQAGGTTDVEVGVSALRLNVAVDVVELATSLQASVLEPLAQPDPTNPLARCSTFTKMWESPAADDGNSLRKALRKKEAGAMLGVTFWRPLPPIGYAVLGHCAARDADQPSFQAVAVAVNSGLVDYPKGFDQVWSAPGLTIWRPQPPTDYVALGCLVSTDEQPPPLSAVVCVHRKVLVSASLGLCLPLRVSSGEKASFIDIWCADNSPATFTIAQPGSGKPSGALDLRAPLGDAPAALPLGPVPSCSSPAAGHSPAQGASLPVTPAAKQRPQEEEQAHSREIARQLSTDRSGALTLTTPPQRRRSRRPTTPQFLAFRRFVKERQLVQRSESSARMKVSSVDFRRIWMDRSTRDPTREGISLWRPVPPPGYFAVGDCIVRGYDPPRQATVLQDADVDKPDPLLKPPRVFELVWCDEAAGRERGLAIWRPVPQPGYVAMGYVCSIGANHTPARTVVRCVRADSVSAVDLAGQRAVVKLGRSRSREELRAWVPDDRLGVFVVGVGGRAPRREELWKMRMLHQLDGVPSAAVETPPNGMNLVVHAEGARLVVRDVLRRPLAELELGEVHAVLRRLTPTVMQASLGVRSSLWSYNPLLTAWEPVIEPWGVLLKLDSNRGHEVSYGTERGTKLSIKSTSEAMHLTLAYAAASHIMDAYLEWKDLQAGAREAYRRQLAAADSASAFTIIDNRLGVPARLELDHGSHTTETVLQPGEEQAVLQPVAVAPMRDAPSAPIVSRDAFPPPLLLVDVLAAAVAVAGGSGGQQPPEAGRQLLVSIKLSSSTAADAGWEVRTRAIVVDNKQRVAWDERLVLEAPSQKDASFIHVELREDAPDGGARAVVGSGNLCLDRSLWKHQSPLKQTLKLKAAKGEQEWQVEVAVALGSERYHEEPEVTDAWSAGKSTAGARALRLESSTWVPISATGRRSLGAAAEPGTDAAVVVPVRVDSEHGVAFETSFQDGVRHETLRSMCQLANACAMPLEVALLDPAVAPRTSQAIVPAARRTAEAPTQQVVSVFENERFMPLRGWSSACLLPTDRSRYTGPRGSNSDTFPQIGLEPGWQWEGAWEVDKSGNTDKDGWAYGLNFPLLPFPPTSANAKKGFTDCVRRKRWVRRKRRVQDPQQAPQRATSMPSAGSAVMVVGVVQPGAKLPLPHNWAADRKQLQIRPAATEGESSHAWSVGASQGEHAVKLDSLRDGLTRLVSCQPLENTPQSGAVWLSITVDGDTFDESDKPALHPLTDWHIVVAPPLVIENTLPIAGHYIVWERPQDGEPQVERQSGQCDSGKRIQVYNADMRCRIALQFWPDDYEWSEKDAVLVSEGFSGHAAGVDRRQLPEKFRVRSVQGNVQGIYMTREITNAWALTREQEPVEGEETQAEEAEQQAAVDPGAAVAVGAALLVRLLVPAWVVNATSLSISAVILPKVRPPRPSQDGKGDPGAEVRRIDAAVTMANIRVLESGFQFRERAVSQQELRPGTLDIVSFPLGTMLPKKSPDDKSGPTHGISFKVESSGWTKPMSLERADIIDAATNGDNEAGQTNKPVLLRAKSADGQTVWEVVARVELVGGVFSRTMAVWLEPRFTVTNLTGLPLQVAQLAQNPAAAAARRFRRGLNHIATLAHGGRDPSQSGSPRPASRSSSGIGGSLLGNILEGGPDRSSLSRSAVARIQSSESSLSRAGSDYLDLTTSGELPAGASNQPVHWSAACVAAQALCLRLGDGSGGAIGAGDEQPSSWSAPLEAALHGGAVQYLALPAGQQSAGAECRLDVHGRRVARHLYLHQGDDGRAQVLRYSVRVAAPGCMALVLEAVEDRAPYQLENRTPHPLLYRPALAPEPGQAPLEFQPLPPWSCVGYAPAVPGGLQRVEVREEYSQSKPAQCYSLDAPSGAGPGAAATDGIGAAADESVDGMLPPLEISVEPKSVQATMADREVEATAAGGLRGVGAGSTLGRHGLDRALRFLPGINQAFAHVGQLADRSADSLSIAVDIGLADLSVVDHTPEELFNLVVMGFRLEYATGIGVEGTYARFNVSIQNLQLDDQLPFTRYPVVIAATEQVPVPGIDEADPDTEPPAVVTFNVVSQPGLQRRQVYYPNISWRLSRVLQVSVSETLLWRTVTLVRRLDLGRLSGAAAADSVTRSASTDVPIQVKLVSLGEVHAKVSFRGDLASRPKWAARMLSLGLDLADFEGVPMALDGFETENATMLWSVFIREVMDAVTAQLMKVAFSFLRNFGILSGASGILGIMSTGVASLGMDTTFAQERIRQRQERSISGVREGLAEGGEALGMGFYRGMTGLVSKPLEGAQSRGLTGFVKGVGKGLVGAVAAPVSGGLDLFSSAVEGLDATKASLLGKPRAGVLLGRHRLPRVIGGDFKLKPFIQHGSEQEARKEEVGQALLWLTGDGASGMKGMPAFLGLRRRHSRGADAYEEHFLLPDDRVAILTSRALLLVVAPTFAKLQRAAETGTAATDMRDVPVSVLRWRVQWDDLLALEPRTGSSAGSRDRLIVHRKGRPGLASPGQDAPLAEELRCFPSTSMGYGLEWCLTPLLPCLLCCFPSSHPVSDAAAALAPIEEHPPLAHQIETFSPQQVDDLRRVALRVAAKYHLEPRRQQLSWQSRHSDSPPSQITGLPKQETPAWTLSMDYVRVWYTPQQRPPVTMWRPVCAPGYAPLGDVVCQGMDPPTHPVRTYKVAWWQEGEGGPHRMKEPPVAHPVDFHLVWRDNGRVPVTMWEPTPPRGYLAVGTVVVGGVDPPASTEVLCVAASLAKAARLFDAPAWSWEPPMLSANVNLQRMKPYEPETWRCSLWQVDNAANTFIAHRSSQRPPPGVATEVSGQLAG